MTDKGKERDWEREMAEVDRLLKKLPEADPTLGRGVPTVPQARPPAGSGGGGGGGVPLTPQAASTLRLGTWLRVALGLLLSVGMLMWPYSHVCGAKLLLYGLGVTTLIVAGVWSALSSWKRRLGRAHVLSIGVVILGVTLAVGIILPRAGGQAIWFCPEPTAAP